MSRAEPTAEVERKFVPVGEQPLPDLTGLAQLGRTTAFDLVATYYDTIDFDLTVAHQVVRRRLGGDDEGWHVKLAGTDSEHRREYHAPLGLTRPPAALRELVAGTLGEQALLPVAELRTHRVQSELRDSAGGLLAYLCDDRVLATAGEHRQAWREAEVELAGGSFDFLEAVTTAFESAGVPWSAEAAKIGQALGPALADHERQAQGVAGAGRVVLAYLAVQIGVLQEREAAVLADLPDAVHRSRVATRRLRSSLRTFAPLFTGDAAARLRAELGWHAAELGAPRDAEVLRDGLLATMDELGLDPQAPERQLLTERLGEEHALAHAELARTMASARYDALHEAMMAFLAAPPFAAVAAEPAVAELHGLLDRARGRVARLHADALAAPDDLTRWHEVRKAAKAVRYGAEALVGVLGERAQAHAALWEAVTDALGQVQDSVVARATVTRLAAEPAVQGGEAGAFTSLLAHHAERGRLHLARGRQALEEALAASL
ncbi:MAG: CYTH and CHAD domain-containing protein [Propionicimonas sp.]|uniref:CYTH and CHAD domain-containing protein n=1 Tax=Propionicimonas sp. TaxID=1955623 RepID=UPI002B1F9C1A|nr:CYTH and CHAD domain-containing protein [Propionicimonas sp.]MEA4943082.1 CYTH and CHAD domain-containing protein [Propionicimonas sp.]